MKEKLVYKENHWYGGELYFIEIKKHVNQFNYLVYTLYSNGEKIFNVRKIITDYNGDKISKDLVTAYKQRYLRC